ncbi:hypothetical protein NBRC10512_007076 [Rhodotorula toruloides]|uniref:RHTO0S16e03576g1_1 n=2 Tax=Rhodotorula toruloides TaxID=5286 RepID=A0A061BMA6_RHOTO|nr:uncharacterized protein RHTO_02313 [Rhodotorula toruloides NP11]EMS20881.1 hypothetical protein RHTO_02313 [Rhodotorula toruloides NP11]CDR48208.1 RHTO0S16e03576g1_1 [Rhodotorula toruloides]
MSGGTLMNGAEAWKAALLRFARSRPLIRGLEIYGPVQEEETLRWGACDLSWVETSAATLERLLLANVAVAHDNTVDHVQLSTLRNLVMSNCTAIVDADPTLRQLIAAATPTADTFRRFLSRMSSLRQLELFDHKYLAADLGMLGPSDLRLANLRTVTVEYKALAWIVPWPHEPFRLFGAQVEHLTVVNARRTFQPVDLHLEWYLDDTSALKTLTLVGTELFPPPLYRAGVQERVAAMVADGKVVNVELRFVTLDEWVYQRVDMAGLSWVAGQRPSR